MENDTSGASVKFPPPLVFIIFMLAAYGMHHFWPARLGSFSGRWFAGAAIILLGIFIVTLAFRSFKRAGTTIEPWEPTAKIISTGVFAYSRNPIYASLCLISIGTGVILNSVWVLLSFLPSVTVVYFIAIRKEEKYLEEKFGENYLQYKNKVKRWL